MKHIEIRKYPLGTKIRAKRKAKYKIIYPYGRVFQTDDLYGETRMVRPEKWYEGILTEGPLIRNGKQHPNRKELYLLTSDNQMVRLKNLCDFELIEVVS